MVMLCLQTSCHRCPSALHNRLVTSTPSLSPLSLIHHVRFDASSGPLAAKALPRARSREPRSSRETRSRGHWPGRGSGIPVEEKRVVDHGDSGARGGGVLASRAGQSLRAKNEPTPPIRRRRDPPSFWSRRRRRGVRFSRNGTLPREGRDRARSRNNH